MDLTNPIEQFDLVSKVQELHWVEHTSDAWIVNAGSREWVYKPEMGVNEVLAEAVAFLVGGLLEIPVPKGAVYMNGPDISWMSHVVEGVIHWDYNLRGSVDNIDVIARLYVLDALVRNEDRHSGNLLLQRQVDGLYKIWAIDMAQAWIGSPESLIGSVEPPDPRGHFRPLPLDDETCQAALDTAHMCASMIQESTLARLAAISCAVTAHQRVEKNLLQALLYRFQAAPAIVNHYLSLLRKL